MKKHIRFGVEVEDVTDTEENENHIYSSQAFQDLFVLGISKYKRNGTFVEIGCSMPRDCNNTYLLEKMGWTGISIDIRAFERLWKRHRTTPFIGADATKINYSQLFKDTFKNITTIDYLSYDIDEASNEVLPIIPFDEYKFRVITIEHDLYSQGYKYKDFQKNLLSSKGYICIAENVCVLDPARRVRGPFEDWWVSEEIYNQYPKYMQNMYGDEILQELYFVTDREYILNNNGLDNFITGNKFKFIADDYLDETKSFIDLSIRPKTIFLFTDWLPLFKQKVLPKIDYQFNLITHNSDLPVKEAHLDILDDKRLIKWYGMNCHIEHPKLQPIPIGIANEKWPHGNKEILMEVINTPVEKIDRVYCNFKPETTSVRRDIIPELLKHDFIDFKEPNLSFKDYLLQLKSYKWVISPPGNSIDCHRIWESIYVGTIPIVLNHICHNSWIDLPIQFINSFTNITIEGLTSQYDQIINKSKEKSRFIYYTEIINE